MIIGRTIAFERPTYITRIHCKTIDVRVFECIKDRLDCIELIDVVIRERRSRIAADLRYFGRPS